MVPDLPEDSYGVALVGEALGETEAEEGGPFKGKAGFQLSRLIKWAGLERSKFGLFNTVWCRPLDNKLEGTEFEIPAVEHCRTHHWGQLTSRFRVLVPMGNVALRAFIGRKGITTERGYVSGQGGQYILPTVHPSYIQRGNSKWSAAFINDIQKAVELADRGLPPLFTNYVLDPSPSRAYAWAQEYRLALAANPSLKLAFDIETPGKDDEEDELELGEQLSDKTWFIWRIGFSFQSGQSLSIPWEGPFIPTIRLLLESEGDKVVWNAGFDVPRIRRQGVGINGTIHDGMVAWHILHSDLPKSLRFVATFTCPWQPAWKHLSSAKPAFYNATDADVEFRSMEVIEAELRKSDLWGVYQRDVLDLEPILQHMQRAGMPVDLEIRMDRAKRLADRLADTRVEMETAVPLGARRIDHVFANEPKDRTGLLSRPGSRTTTRCPNCQILRPRKDHFKSFVKKVNPCSGLQPENCNVAVEEYYRLAEFTPSRDQLIRYHQFLNRPLPMVYDKKERKKKVSFGERQIKDLSAKYSDDKLYQAILVWRSLDKLAGTYIGRIVDDTTEVVV